MGLLSKIGKLHRKINPLGGLVLKGVSKLAGALAGGGGGGNKNQNQNSLGFMSAFKQMTQQAAAPQFQMPEFVMPEFHFPKFPDPPKLPDYDKVFDQKTDEMRKKLHSARGRKSTVKTSAMGLLSAEASGTTIKRKSLFGE